MAKSQTKVKTTKPPVAAKAAGVATIAMTQDLRMIPLDQLDLSPLNVRKGDGRGKPVDAVHVCFADLIYQPPRIGGDGLKKPSLGFCEQCAKRQ